MNYREIFDLILDENDFTVGGGSSSAIVGAMACGLMGKQVRLLWEASSSLLLCLSLPYSLPSSAISISYYLSSLLYGWE